MSSVRVCVVVTVFVLAVSGSAHAQRGGGREEGSLLPGFGAGGLLGGILGGDDE